MAGGIFTIQNKVRPGAYIDVIAKKNRNVPENARGIVSLIVEPSFAKKGFTKITVEDYLSGDYKKNYPLDDTNSQINDALKFAFLGGATVVYAWNKYLNSTNASAEVTTSVGNFPIFANAKLPGGGANNLKFELVDNDDDTFTRYIYKTSVIDGSLVDIVIDKLVVSSWIEFLTANDYISFSMAPAKYTESLEEIDKTQLTGGTNGSSGDDYIEGYINGVKTLNEVNGVAFNTPIQSADEEKIINCIRYMRDTKGIYCQGVIHGVHDNVNYEGIIKFKQSLQDDNAYYSSPAAAYITALSASSKPNVSNTYKVLDYFTGITDYTNEQIIEGINAGYLMFSTRRDGAKIIEKDINSLHVFTDERTYPFSKNRVMRTLDDIATKLCNIFEQNYIGKVTNNEEGRSIFKADVMSILAEYNTMGCIEPVPVEDVEVLQGNDIESVVLNLLIQPNDSMEKLYCTITVK